MLLQETGGHTLSSTVLSICRCQKNCREGLAVTHSTDWVAAIALVVRAPRLTKIGKTGSATTRTMSFALSTGQTQTV